jgi:hypothetical protein
VVGGGTVYRQAKGRVVWGGCENKSEREGERERESEIGSRATIDTVPEL